jgi:dTDP-4-dehydrorhamnose reductase
VKTILIVGGSGFVGSHLALRLRDEYKVMTTHFRHAQRIPGVTDYPLSVHQLDWSKELLLDLQPDVILYAAGRHSPQWTEDPANARAMDLAHVAGPSTLVSNSQVMGTKFIYLSSPLVFDGARGNYHESDILMPSSPLGRAKVAGENSIKNRALNYLILRSAPLVGRGPAKNPTFLDQWLLAWGRGRAVELDDSIRHSYATIENFCDWVAQTLASGLKNKVLHFGGLSRVTEYELAHRLAERLEVSPTLLHRKKAPSEQSSLDYSLNTTASVRALEVQPLLLQQSLDLIQQHLLIT